MKKRRQISADGAVKVTIGPLRAARELDTDGALVAPRANDTQVGGRHYKMRAIEPWDIVALLGLDPFQADILYYLLRWKEKSGIEDLEKAQHWLQKYIEVERLRRERGDSGMCAALLEAAYNKAQTRAAEEDRDANLYFGMVRGHQREFFSDSLRKLRDKAGEEFCKEAAAALSPKPRRRAKR